MPTHIDFVNIILYKIIRMVNPDIHEPDEHFCDLPLPLEELPPHAQQYIRECILRAVNNVLGDWSTVQCAFDGNVMRVYRLKEEMGRVGHEYSHEEARRNIVAALKEALGALPDPEPHVPFPSMEALTDADLDAYRKIAREPRQRENPAMRFWKWLTGADIREEKAERFGADLSLRQIHQEAEKSHDFLESLKLRIWLQREEIRQKCDLLRSEATAPVEQSQKAVIKDHKAADWIIIAVDATPLSCLVAMHEGEHPNFSRYKIDTKDAEGNALKISALTSTGMRAEIELKAIKNAERGTFVFRGLRIEWQPGSERKAPSWKVTTEGDAVLFAQRDDVRQGQGIIVGWRGS